MKQDNSQDNSSKRSAFERGSTDEDKVTRFVAGSAISTIAQIVGGAFGFVWMIVLSRLMAPEKMGILSPFLPTFWIVSGAVSIGIPTAITTYMSHHLNTNPDRAYRYGWEGMRAEVFLGTGTSVLLAVAAFVLFLTGRLPSNIPSWVWLGWLLALAFANLVRQGYFGPMGILMGVQRLDMVGYCNMVFPIIYCLASILFVIGARKIFGSASEMDIIFGAFGIGVGAAASAALSILYLNRIRFHKARDWYRIRGRGEVLGQLLAFGWLSAIALTGYTAIKDISSPLVMFLAVKNVFAPAGVSDPAQALTISRTYSGYFSTAIMYAQTPMMVLGLTNALIPAISQAHSEGKREMMQRMYDLATKYVFFLIGCIIAVFAVGIGRLAELAQGKEYPAAQMHALALILGIAGSIGAVLYLHINMFLGLKRPKISAGLTIGVLIFEVPSIWLLTLAFKDIRVAALGFAVAVFVGLMAAIILVRRVGLRFPIYTVISPAVAGGLTWLIVSRIWSPTHPKAPVGMLLAVFVYIVLALFFGALDNEDFAMFGQISSSGDEQEKAKKFGVGTIFSSIARVSPFFEWHKKIGRKPSV